MVQVKNYHHRQNAEGKPYISLELTGELELVQSQQTGRFYATQRRCFISSTFDEATAQLLIGKTLAGTIVRTSCDPYEYTVPDTGEVIVLTYRYSYVPEGNSASFAMPSSLVPAGD